MMRINLLRHLPASEARAPKTSRGFRASRGTKAVKAPKPPREPREPSGAGKRLLGTLAVLALVAGAVWFFAYSPYASRLDWRRLKPAVAAQTADSARQAREALERLEAEAMAEIAARQRTAVDLMTALEAFLPGAAPGVARAVLSPPADFVLRGTARSAEALSRLQETLVLVPGLNLARSESRGDKAGTGLEFIFAGGVSADAPDSAQVVDSALTAPAPGLPDEAGLDRAWAAFLENAEAAGVSFATLPAGAPTVSGSLKAHPYRVQAACAPAILREFLASAQVQGSPFGIRRITWETAPAASRQTLVSLDIMAFSRR